MTPALRTIRQELKAGMIDRDTEVDLALIALLSGTNLLLVGEPGTAKSMLLSSVVNATAGATKFEQLLTSYTQPDELFGPWLLAEYEKGNHIRAIEGYLPTANMVFLDEVFKASSAILNTMLMILNEGKYKHGRDLIDVPVLLTVGASNEWPNTQDTGNSLNALFDRFLLRQTVSPIRTRAGKARLWKDDTINGSVKTSVQLSLEEISIMRAQVSTLPFSNDFWEVQETLIATLAKEGILPGDRRQRKFRQVLRAAAFLEGAPEVRPDHLEIGEFSLWDDPGQATKTREIILKLANPAGAQISEIMLAADAIMGDPKLATDLGVKVKSHGQLVELVNRLQALQQSDRRDRAITLVRTWAQEVKASVAL